MAKIKSLKIDSAWAKLIPDTGSQSIITDSLVLYYDLSNTSSYAGSGTNLYDLTTNDNDATLLGSPTPYFVSDGNKSNLEFNGSSGYLRMARSTTLQFGTGDFTIETWVNIDSKTTTYPVIFANYTTWGGTTVYWGYGHQGISTTKYTFYDYAGVNVPSTNDVSWGNWEHVALVRTGSKAQIYRNGVLASGDANVSTNSYPGSGDYCYVAYGDGGWYISGSIAIYRIYKGKALSPTELTLNYNIEKGRFGL